MLPFSGRETVDHISRDGGCELAKGELRSMTGETSQTHEKLINGQQEAASSRWGDLGDV